MTQNNKLSTVTGIMDDSTKVGTVTINVTNGEHIKLLNDNEVYLGNQVESLFNDENVKNALEYSRI